MRAHRRHLVHAQEAAGKGGSTDCCRHGVTPTATVFVIDSSPVELWLISCYESPMEWADARRLFLVIVNTLDAVPSYWNRASSMSNRPLILVAGTPPKEIRICDFFGAAALDVGTFRDEFRSVSHSTPRKGDLGIPPAASMDWFSMRAL